MKTYQLLARLGQPLKSRIRKVAARRGTVIIVVLALLGMLALIGFFVFAFTASENQSATYFTNSQIAKVNTPTLNADAFFTDALRQIIVGPQAGEKQSVLWGGNKSLLPTMWGRGLAPYTGPGINLFWNTTLNQASVDQNYNSKPDDGTAGEPDNRALTFLNLAPSAAAAWQPNTPYITGSFVRPLTNNSFGLLYVATAPGTSSAGEPTWAAAGTSVTDGGVTWVGASALDLNNYPFAGNLYPDPDTNTTYPDINSAFLGYDALVPSVGSPLLPTRVITPSFHRPQYLRNATSTGGGNVLPLNWYTDPLTANRVLFPHLEHGCIDNNGDILAAQITVNGNTYSTQRYVSFTHPDTSSTAAAWAAGTPYTVGQIVQASPASATNLSNFLCTQAGTSGATQPIWPTATGGTVQDGTSPTQIVWQNISVQPFGIPGQPFTGIPGDGNANTAIPPSQEGVWSAAPAWAASTTYTVEAQVTPAPATGQVFTCTTAGTSGGTQPAWPPLVPAPAIGTTVADGGVTWTYTGPAINYMADTDSDGVLDAYYVDLGFPLMTAPGTNTQFVAMAAIKILDADAYFNLNVHGNRSGSVTLGPAPIPIPFGGVGSLPNTTQFLSKSNLGISASEVNPEWALNARPAVAADAPTSGTVAAALVQYVSFFRSPVQSTTLPTDDHSAGNFELANMEWWNILNGRPQLTPSATPTTTPATVSGSSFPGRWGENASRLDPIVTEVLAGTTPIQAGAAAGFGGPNGKDPFPLPGVSVSNAPTDNSQDDDNNAQESGAYTNTTTNVTYPAFVHPLDFFGAGFWVSGVEGKARLLITEGQQKYPGYQNYFTNPGVLWTQASFGGPAGVLMPGGNPQLQIDNADEEFTETAYISTSDNIFSPSENLLQLSSADFQTFGSLSRAATLAPYNLSLTARASQIRQRFTSTSWDLKTFAKEFLGTYTGGVAPTDARRLWEFTDKSPGATGIGPFRFPPDFGGTGVNVPPPVTQITYTGTFAPPNPIYPLRLDLAHLLWIWADPNQKLGTSATILPQRPMSINGLVEQVDTLQKDSSGNEIYTFRFRPLTPHASSTSPAGSVPNTAITPPAHTSDGIGYVINRPEQLAGGNVQQQEWLARYDRQRLARDIYTLLYLTGGGNDAMNYATTSNALVGGARAVYTDDQLREMAQFAVNVVDALDPDTNITVFEYDKNLADGWNLDDNAYDGIADTQPPFNIPPADRGVVYGVERQQLAFNEAQVIFAECVGAGVPIDHPDTQYNESLGYWGFFFAELENVSPFPVTFANQGWQIAVKESPINTLPSGFYGQETRVIIGANQPDVQTGPNARFTVGTVGATLNGTSYISNLNTAAATPTPFPSYFVVDPNDGDPIYHGGPFDQRPGFPIAPRAAFVNNGPTTPPGTNPNALSLDMVLQPNNCFVMPALGAGSPFDGIIFTPSSATAPNGTQFLQFANWPNITQTSQITLRVELRRRADILRQPPTLPIDALTQSQNQTQEQDNPWIVVDYMDVPVGLFMLQPGNNFQQIQAQLQPGGGSLFPVVSTERSQPLFHANNLTPNGGKTSDVAPTWQANSLGQDNDAPNAVLPHTLYQPHYDRDFSSVIELFNVPLWGPYGPGSDAAINSSVNSGLAYRMASRFSDTGTPITPEVLAGGDWNNITTVTPPQTQGHSLGFGTAGYRFLHPEGGGLTPPTPTTDLTENRWHRMLGLVEVPTRSHRQLEEPNYVTAGTISGQLGFYRTPGKINLNTLRHPDVLAGLLDEGDVFALSYSNQYPQGMPTGLGTLQVPLSLPDQNADTVVNPAAGTNRDWWLQFLTARDGIDPLPTANGGSNLSLPGLPRYSSGIAPAAWPAGLSTGVAVPPGSHPFRGLGFSAFANGTPSVPPGFGGEDVNGYNSTLDSTIFRALPGDAVTPLGTGTPPDSPDGRRRIFELGQSTEHSTDAIDYAVRNRVLSKILQNTTTRSNVFLVWIQVDFFTARDINPPNGVVRIGQMLPKTAGTPGGATTPSYRGFYVVDRSQAMSSMQQQYLPSASASPFVFSLNPSFNWQSLVLFQQRLQ